MQKGDRVTSKLSGKSGVLMNVYLPIDRSKYGIMFGKMRRDDGNIETSSINNFVPEGEYVEKKYDPVGDNNKDKIDMITDEESASDVESFEDKITDLTSDEEPSVALTSDNDANDNGKPCADNEFATENTTVKKRGRKPKEVPGLSVDDIVGGTIESE